MTRSSSRTNRPERLIEADDGGGGGRPDQEEMQSRLQCVIRKKQRLQANRHASRVAEAYRFELEAGQGILQKLKEGDEIALLANAVFPGWVNNVEEAGMEIWEEDDLPQMVADLHEQRQSGGDI